MEDINGDLYNVVQLRDWLRHLGLPMSGNKAALVLRLNAVSAEVRGACPVADEDADDDDEDANNGDDESDEHEDGAENNNAVAVDRDLCREIELLKRELFLAEREKQLLKKENEFLKRENSVKASTPSVQGGSATSVAAMKGFLPEYDGTGSVELWITQLENLGRSFELQDDMLKALLMCNVKGNAQAWLHSKPDYISADVHTLFDEMRAAFKSPGSKLVQRRKFESRKWTNGENFAQYYNEKMRLSSGLQFEDAELVEHLVEGINNYQLRTQATIQCFNRPDDLLRAFSKVELPSVNKQALNITTADRENKISARCYNCNSVGHFAKDCRKPKREGGTCYGCGSADHMITTCPRRKGIHVVQDIQEAP